MSRSAHDVTESLAEKKRFTDGKDVPHDNLHLGDLMASKIVSKERQSLTKMPPKTDPIETVHAVTSKK